MLATYFGTVSTQSGAVNSQLTVSKASVSQLLSYSAQRLKRVVRQAVTATVSTVVGVAVSTTVSMTGIATASGTASVTASAKSDCDSKCNGKCDSQSKQLNVTASAKKCATVSAIVGVPVSPTVSADGSQCESWVQRCATVKQRLGSNPCNRIDDRSTPPKIPA